MINKILSDKNLAVLFEKYSDFYSQKDFLNQIRTAPYAASSLVEEIGSYLKNKLKDDPADLDLLVTLALVYLLTPMEDFETSAQYCRKGLEIETGEIRSILILAYTYDLHMGEITDDILEMLLSIDSSDNKLMSAKYLFVSRYYFNKDDSIKYQENLNKALGYFNGNLAAIRCLYDHKRDQYDVNNIEVAQKIKFYSTRYREEYQKANATDIIEFNFFLCNSIFLLTEDSIL
jgi:hypothetical protein